MLLPLGRSRCLLPTLASFRRCPCQQLVGEQQRASCQTWHLLAGPLNPSGWHLQSSLSSPRWVPVWPPAPESQDECTHSFSQLGSSLPRGHSSDTHACRQIYSIHTHALICKYTCSHNHTHNWKHTHIHTHTTSTQQTASSVNICSSGGCFCFPLLFHHQGLAVRLCCYCCHFNHRPCCNWQLGTKSNPHKRLIKYANASWD